VIELLLADRRAIKDKLIDLNKMFAIELEKGATATAV